MRALKIEPNCKPFMTELPDREQLWMSMRDAIGCYCIGIASIFLEGLEDYCIVYDDEALLCGTPQINSLASVLYGFYEHGQPICGTVLVMKNHYNEEGELTTVGLTKQDADKITHTLACIIARKLVEHHTLVLYRSYLKGSRKGNAYDTYRNA